jgi:hypothetical protein
MHCRLGDFVTRRHCRALLGRLPKRCTARPGMSPAFCGSHAALLPLALVPGCTRWLAAAPQLPPSLPASSCPSSRAAGASAWRQGPSAGAARGPGAQATNLGTRPACGGPAQPSAHDESSGTCATHATTLNDSLAHGVGRASPELWHALHVVETTQHKQWRFNRFTLPLWHPAGYGTGRAALLRLSAPN